VARHARRARRHKGGGETTACGEKALGNRLAVNGRKIDLIVQPFNTFFDNEEDFETD
jgi:hypothetical protein